MSIVGAFDVHRCQLTFDYLDTAADRHRLTRGLVRIDPDHHCRHHLPLPWYWSGPWQARLIPERCGARPLLSHATASPRQAGTSFGSRAQQGGRRLENS